jgi:predicted nucleotidyltransferase component of viral defense system
MIPNAFIREWRAHAPWQSDAQVEQDLVITRALVDIYSDPELAHRLAFRGGTALYKLHLRPAARYSEDIDLVQVRAEPIGETLDLLKRALDPWLGEPRRVAKAGRVNLVYRYASEDSPSQTMRLKIEINSREHFTELGLIELPVELEGRWYSGAAKVTTFALDELLATKLRALYQRKKGRDLFDLWFASRHAAVDSDQMLRCFERYMAEGGHRVSRAQFEANLHRKSGDVDFRSDIVPLLRPTVAWNFDEACRAVRERFIDRLAGDPWQG